MKEIIDFKDIVLTNVHAHNTYDVVDGKVSLMKESKIESMAVYFEVNGWKKSVYISGEVLDAVMLLLIKEARKILKDEAENKQ